jgi:hypothetical protein
MNEKTTMTTRNPYANIGHTRTSRSQGGVSLKERAALQEMPAVAESKLPGLTRLFHHSPIITVLAQVQDYTLVWGGRISCTLLLSTGHRISLHTNRDKLSPEIGVGAWVHAKLLLGRGENSDHALLQATQVTIGDTDPTTAWLPVAAYLRNGHMHKLRMLLSGMEPAMQAVFMGVMSELRVQQGFLGRVSACDHHGYPGGLFDHSVCAAEAVWAQTQLSARERGIGALACLLFELGKASDALLRPDAGRLANGLSPHPMSLPIVDKTLLRIAPADPELAQQIRFLLQDAQVELETLPTEMGTLQQCVYQAIADSWVAVPSVYGDLHSSRGGRA